MIGLSTKGIGALLKSSRASSSAWWQNLLPSSKGTREYHVPVYLRDCCDQLLVEPGKVFVDCTLGGGGHTREILLRGGKVIAIDRDIDSIERAKESLASYIKSNDLEIHLDNFKNLKSILKSSKLAASNNGLVDGVLMDLGVSSHQIDEPGRGFAFRFDGPLDMRMDQSTDPSSILRSKSEKTQLLSPAVSNPSSPLTAHEIVNKWSLTDIANTLYQYGDERLSRQIAREIVSSRPLNSSKDLTEAVSRIVPSSQRQKSLARCYQALRIVVNGEISCLRELLTALDSVIVNKGRFVALSYHSIEDRLVKNLIKNGYLIDEDDTFGDKSSNGQNQQNQISDYTSANSMQSKSLRKSPWKLVLKKMDVPEAEVKSNNRSRSAKMRVAEKGVE